MSRPDFKNCPYFRRESGKCRRSIQIPELKDLTDHKFEAQCCYMMPVPAYECPNPDYNTQASQEVEEKELEVFEKTEDKIHSLNNVPDNYLLDTITEVLEDFRKDLLKIKEEVRQETKKTLETLESRVTSIEKGIYAEKKADINLPNGEVYRGNIRRKSRKAKLDKEFTDQNEADKEFKDKIENVSLNTDLLNENFFEKELDPDEIEEILNSELNENED